MAEIVTDVFRNTLMITAFVIVIMLFIELLNVFTHGKWSSWIARYPALQVLMATLLGLIPGCFGGFAVVGMWTHGLISFGSLLAAMISSVGDEAFVMLVQMPGKAFLLFVILAGIALLIGLVVDKAGWKIAPPDTANHLVVHSHEHDVHFCVRHGIKNNFKNPSFTRILLITGVGLFIIGMLGGFFGHDHSNEHASNTLPMLNEEWFNGIFVVLALCMLVTFFVVDDHFLEEHLWKHIIKQHVPKIFLWTAGALTIIHFLMHSVETTEWMAQHSFWILILAVLIGFIPESGPHLLFITLFLSGAVPFSVLLANSITQDGHSTLPLLAESKRGFFSVKLFNGLVGLLVGLAGYFLGF